MSPAKPTEAPSPLDFAEAAVRQQKALLDDAKKQAEAAAATRAKVEKDVATAETVHAAALKASAAKRGDDSLADAAARASIRLAHARDDLARGVRDHAAASSAVATAENNVADASRTHEIMRLQDGLNERMQAPIVNEIVSGLVDNAIALRRGLVELRGLLAADHADVQRIAALGGRAQPADGTAFAGRLATALLRNGAVSPVPNPHEWRWLFEDTGAGSSTDTDGSVGAIQVATKVLAALSYGDRQLKMHGPAASVASTGRKVLEIVAGWAPFRTKGEADWHTEQEARQEGEAIAKRHADAHSLRLVKASREAARLKGRPRRADGTPIGEPPMHPVSRPVPARPHPMAADRPDGEFQIGDPDDFSGRSRPLTVG